MQNVTQSMNHLKCKISKTWYYIKLKFSTHPNTCIYKIENVDDVNFFSNCSTISNTYKNLDCYLERMMSEQPMFEVNAVLLMSEIVLEPSASELQNIMVQSAKDFLSR